MRIQLLAVGNRMPDWVNTAYHEYASRMPPECRLELREITAGKRGKTVDTGRILKQECNGLLNAVPSDHRLIALDVKGRAWSTEELSVQMDRWMQDGRDVSLMIGGPEGLDAECRKRAEQHWSLSPLTFPHPMVRVIVAEQLYRAWSILRNHPYHRA
jgi:23S rRNA (pseudouridine1915-N3)-methyltransferase